jgi:hypothetical protein
MFVPVFPQAHIDEFTETHFRFDALGFGAVWTRRSSVLKMQILCFCETLASTDESTWRLNPEERHHQTYHRDNLKSHTVQLYLITV